MHTLWQDFRYALRMLHRARGYALVVVATLGLAVGAVTTVFSVVDGVLLRPLGYRDPERLVSIWEKHPQFLEMAVSYPNYIDWRKAQRSFEDIAAVRLEDLSLTGLDRPERVQGRMVTASLLPVLGIAPSLGRAFTEEEDRAGAPRVAMISYAFWKRRFGGDVAAVGKTIVLDGAPHTVVGVMPERFRLPFRFAVPTGDVFISFARHAERSPHRGTHSGFAVGRLKPGVTVEQARADLEAVGRDLGRVYDTNRDVLPALAPLHADLVRDDRTTLLLLMGLVMFVLLIAIANVANLALARGVTRRKEMAVRAALGAGRWRLMRQLLLESLLLALAGGAVGLLLAAWGVDLARSARAETLPTTAVIQLDWRLAAFALVSSVLAGMLIGVVPALFVSRADVADALRKTDSRATGGVAHHRLRGILIIGEVALALVLLAGAGLSLNAFLRLLRADPGFRPDGVLTARMFAPPDKYPGAVELRTFLDRVRERVKEIPGVEAVAIGNGLPLKGASETSFRIEGTAPPAGELPFAVAYAADVHQAEAMGLRLVSGRWFTAADGRDAPAVAVIDEALARRFFPAGDAVGHRIVNFEPPLTIVGVVGHVAHYGFGVPEPAPFQMYYLGGQLDDAAVLNVLRGFDLVVRARVAPEALAPAVAAAVSEVDPEQPVFEVKSMSQLVDEVNRDRRFVMTLLVAFAGLALLLAMIGLCAVLSFLVAQRTHEIGVRMALGAQAGDVRRLVLGHGMRLAAVGIALGLGGALALGHLMAGLLYQVQPRDPPTLALVAAVLAFTAGAACYLPSRRATRVDPMVTLRGE